MVEANNSLFLSAATHPSASTYKNNNPAGQYHKTHSVVAAAAATGGYSRVSPRINFIKSLRAAAAVQALDSRNAR